MQTLTPTAVRLNNLSGSAADLDDSPDAPDASWCTKLGAYAWTASPSVGTLRLVGQVPVIPGDVTYLYVNASTGDDSRTKAQAANPSTPWATVGRAARGSTSWASPNASEAAAAGDTVLVASGIYWEDGYRGGDASLNKESVACNPANSGTAGNPITFIGAGMPQLRMQENARGGVIGANNRSYIVWDGFDIDDTYCGSASDFGPVVLDVGAHHVTVQNCQIQGHNGSYYWGYATYDGNYRLVALEDVYNCTIRNNKISRALIGASPGGQNEAGVMSYDSHDNVIEQNTITNCGSGIFIKGVHPGDDQSSNVVRYNLIYACHSAGIRVLDAEPDGDTRVYQNILIDTSTGIWAGFSYSRASKFYNNVIYSTDRGRVGHGTDLIDVEFRNSIVMSCTAASYDFSANVPSGQDVFYERNLYYNNTRIWSSESGNNASTLAAWQAYGAMCDANGASGDPLFINASTNPAVADFHLDTSSPAEELGRDYYGTFGGDSTTVIPAGAYVTGSEQIGADW